jgi:chemotaxis protein histidine kinase CheA
MSESDSEIVKEFLVESYENLDRLDRELVGLEKNPQDRDALGSVFRTIHTIKGTCGFLGFNKLEKVAHVGENLLSRLRDGQLKLNPELTTALLGMVDAVRGMLGSIEANGVEGERDDTLLIATLTRLQQPSEAQPKIEVAALPKSPSQAAEVPSNIGDILMQRTDVSPAEIMLAAKQQNEGDPRRLGEILVERGAVQPADIVDALHIQQSSRAQASASDSTIRVDVGLLDKVMNLVGELVLARNQVLQFANRMKDTSFLAASQRLNLITTELQEGVMKTRMQPIGNIWGQFPRTVRDVALGCGKEVKIEMEGKETELDKTIIEAIKDPLTHLVRNSVDHGIELPEERVKAGKDRTGRLILRAFHEGGQVIIEISDDGAGLNTERIRRKAVERATVTAEQAARMTEREIFNLIFLPGFSTAEKVTNVSGRGVGMDVVKTNVEKIGGTVDVQSTLGRGTTVRVKIPLTLAIIPALVVTCGGDRYAIPQVSLLELVRLKADEVGKGIEMVQGAPVHRLRGRLLPLVYLDRELNLAAIQGQGMGQPSAHSGSEGQSLDFAQARLKHQQWLGRLREVLDGSAAMTLQRGGSHTECALGKWLYSIGLKKYGDFPEIHSVEKTHHEFHGLVAKILSLKDQGDQAQAEQAFIQLGELSAKILVLLTDLEKKVIDSGSVNIVVLQADGRQFGLVVDDINDTEEIVVKPLGKQLKGVNTFAGATIMGDGKVALILDALGLAQRANVVSAVHDHAVEHRESSTVEKIAGNRQTLLLFQTGKHGRMAIPLSLVARLEEFAGSKVESTGQRQVVQYRGQIMPLIRVAEALDLPESERGPTAAEADVPMQVVVYAERGRSVGLVVERILDIVEEDVVLDRLAERAGILGTAVVQQRVTDMLDVPGVVRAAHPGFFTETAAT